MQIRSENDLKLAYETINSFKEIMPMAQKTDVALEYIKELKRDIRAFFRKEKEKPQRRLVKDDGIDGYIVLIQLPSFLNSKEDAAVLWIRRGVQEAERKPEQIQESDGGTGQERKTKGRKRMRKKYYHAATPETMEKIIADGVVKRGWDGCVYLCEKPQDAAKFVAIRGHDEVAVIEVILPANKVKESFDHSVQFFQCKAFMYEEDIKVRQNAEVVEYSFK